MENYTPSACYTLVLVWLNFVQKLSSRGLVKIESDPHMPFQSCHREVSLLEILQYNK